MTDEPTDEREMTEEERLEEEEERRRVQERLANAKGARMDDIKAKASTEDTANRLAELDFSFDFS